MNRGLHSHTKPQQFVRGLTGILVAFAAVTLAVVLAYFLTSFLYSWLRLNPPALLAQVINTLVGLLFITLAITCMSFLFRSQQIRMQMTVFVPIIEAMEKIAKGDYTVQLDNQFPDNQPFGQLVKSVNEMAVNLNEMEVMRQEFVSNVSHEIQSPLTSIRGFAQALSHNHLSPEERTRYLSIIVLESTRLSKLTENLLELASLDAEHVKFDPKPYRLDKQIQNLILSCEPQWQGKHLNLDAALAEVTINADEDLLSEVWLNLLHNSFKFTAEDGCVQVALHQPNGLIEFQIKDTGLGIAEADQPRIFERFYKADPARDRSKGGSGLGLSIVKKIVDLHHGTISIQSQLGLGTTFTVCLPVTNTPTVTPSDPAVAVPTTQPKAKTPGSLN